MLSQSDLPAHSDWQATGDPEGTEDQSGGSLGSGLGGSNRGLGGNSSPRHPHPLGVNSVRAPHPPPSPECSPDLVPPPSGSAQQPREGETVQYVDDISEVVWDTSLTLPLNKHWVKKNVPKPIP